MNNKQFGIQLEKRTRKFAISVLKLSGQLPRSREASVIRNQISKSGTSVGANYREANRSRSRADFRNKIKISAGELNETIYWLEIIREMNWVESSSMISVEREGKELLALFSSITKSLN